MRALLDVILIVLQIYVWLLIASAILSWLIAFNVVNTRNQFVAMAADFLYRITEPALRPIRQMMPNLGGLDISPVILILLILLILADAVSHLALEITEHALVIDTAGTVQTLAELRGMGFGIVLDDEHVGPGGDAAGVAGAEEFTCC